MNFRFIFFILFFSSFEQQAAFQTIQDASNLTRSLFKGYDREQRPVYYQNESVSVNVTYYLLTLDHFDAVSGVLSSVGAFMMTWFDYRLQWNPSDYGGVQSFMVARSKVWSPEIFILNTANTMEMIGSDNFRIRIYFNGNMLYSPGGRMKTKCNVNMKKFPKDTQICNTEILSWSFNPSELVLLPVERVFNLELYQKHAEWNIIKTSITEIQEYQQYVSALSFSLTIQRKGAYYIMITLIPILLLWILNPFVFFLPAASGERVSYTITSFLSFAVYMTMISDNMPKSAEPVALLCLYLIVALISSGLITVSTLFTLCLHNKPKAEEFPKWILCLIRSTSSKFSKINVKNQVQKDELQDVSDFESQITVDGNTQKTKTTLHSPKSDDVEIKTNETSLAWEEKQTVDNAGTFPKKQEILRYIDIRLFIFYELVVVVATSVYFTSISM